MIAWLRARAEWAWFGIAAGVLFLVALLLGRRQSRKPPALPLEQRIDQAIGRADATAERREALSEEITAVERDIARVTTESQGLSAAEIAARWKARK